MSEAPEDDDRHESDPMRDLVKRALAQDTGSPPDLLPGVQSRLRRRSRGKFFADGWSTTQARQGAMLVALVTLLLAAVVYYALGSLALR